MNKEALENHKAYLKRKAIYKSFGYDIDKERDFIIEKAKPFSERILEAGTGKGHFTLALAKQGFEVTSFDISEDEQHFARLNLEYFGLENQVNFIIGNAEKTSFADSSFDTIFCVNAFHHLQHSFKVLDELLRLLSLGAKMIIADFTKEGFKILDNIHKAEGRVHESSTATLGQVKEYLEKKGFPVESKKSKYQQVLILKRAV